MTDLASLRIGCGSELPLQASKWLDLQLLIDIDEMKTLFSVLGDFEIFRIGIVCDVNEGLVSKEQFLNVYEAYIDLLKRGEIPDEKMFRSYFSSVFTTTRDPIFRILVGSNRHILRVEKPILQLQMNRMAYSQADGKFRGMVFGKDSIYWGLQFSYPQLFQDAVTKEVFTVSDQPKFPNTSLYRKLQLFVRQQTIPTPFRVGDSKMNVPMRLGRQCLPWINSHAQLSKANITVIV